MLELQFKIVGVLFIFLAVVHAFFPNRFRWRQELGPLSLINRQMMYVHLFFIALLIFLLGLLCLTSSDALLNTALGRRISLGLALFWAIRLYFQFFVYSAQLWKGKPFETTMHIFFSFFWAYASTVFLLGYLKNYLA
jgi:hypothetical protein